MAKHKPTATAERGTGPHPVRATALLTLLAIWLAVVPFVGPALGFELDVPTRLEVIDHVVPGVVVLIAAVTALLLRGRPIAQYAFAVAAGASLLAGIWALSTHVPLMVQANQDIVPWSTALFHTAPGPVVVLVSLLALVPALRAVE